MDFSTATTAISAKGSRTYAEELETSIISDTKKYLDDYTEMFNCFKENWSGQAEEKFEANVKQAVYEIETTMNSIKKSVISTLNQVKDDMTTLDTNIVS